MLSLSYDLHVHSCLSPCGDNEMTPANIAGMAFVKGLDVIALTDHNSSKNCEAVKKAAESYGLTVLCGMELTTQEEVHVVCLFSELKKAMRWDSYVYERLLKIPNDADIFGKQLVMDAEENILYEEPYLLINATDIAFDSVFSLVKSFGGVAFPAHIDKTSNSLISNLGFIPPESSFNCVELKNPDNFKRLSGQFPYLCSCKVLINSDAHYLQDISEPVNFLHSKTKSAQDILEALEGKKV
jgi:hypothetical protein